MDRRVVGHIDRTMVTSSRVTLEREAQDVPCVCVCSTKDKIAVTQWEEAKQNTVRNLQSRSDSAPIRSMGARRQINI